MKRYYIRLLVLLFYIQQGSAQSQQADTIQFIQLHSGTKIIGQNVLFKQPAFQPGYFEVDGNKYLFSSVKTVKNKNGYYICTGTNINSVDGFAMRTVEGKINFYERRVSKSPNKRRYCYWDKNSSDYQEATDESIYRAVAASPQAIRYLRDVKIARNVLIPASLVCIFAPLALPRAGSIGLYTSVPGLFTLEACVFGSHHYYWKRAVKIYNKEAG